MEVAKKNKILGEGFFPLASGLVIGQGAFLGAQVYLAAHEQYQLVAEVGIAVGIVSLFQWLADFGGIFLLPKALSKKKPSVELLHFLAARLALALILSGVIYHCRHFLPVSELGHEILASAGIAVLIWSANLSGLLDYAGKNSAAGPASGLCWLFVSVTVVVSFYSSGELDGREIGIAYLLGLLSTILIQYCTMSGMIQHSADVRFFDWSTSKFVSHGLDMLTYTATYFAGQVYGRTVPVLLDVTVGGQITGMYLLARSGLGAVSQLVSVSRRVEFRIVLDISNKSASLKDIVHSQRLSFWIAGAALVSLCIVFPFSESIPLPEINRVAVFLLLFFGLNLIWNYAAVLAQYLIAVGQLNVYMAVQVLTILVAVLVLVVFIEPIGVYAAFIADSVLYVLQAAAYTCFLAKRRRVSAVREDDGY